jgi:hypothetical protein
MSIDVSRALGHGQDIGEDMCSVDILNLLIGASSPSVKVFDISLLSDLIMMR